LSVFGPVFWKELLEAARRKRYYLLRCVIPSLFLFVFSVEAIESGWRRQAHTPILQQQARMGREFFEVWTVFLTITLGLAAPLLVGGLIASERERGSLDLLFTTDLTGREIVLGKVASRISILWLLVFGSAPVLELIGFLGGVGFEQMFSVLALTLSGAALISSVGLFYSAVTKRPWIAIVRTYFFFGVCWFVVPICGFALVYTIMDVFGLNSYYRNPFQHPWLVVLHLPICLVAQFEPSVGAPLASSVLALANSTVSWVLAAFFLFLTHRNLRNDPSMTTGWWIFAPIRWLKRLGLWAAAPLLRGFAAIAPATGLSKFALTPERLERLLDHQPVAWRNLKASVFDPEHYLSRIQGFLIVVMIGFLGIGTIAFGPPRARDFVAFFLLTLLVLHFLLGVLAAGAISRERERGSLDLLRMTMLTPHHVLFGNLVGAFRAVRTAIWAIATLFVYSILFDVFTISFAAQYAAVLAVGAACIAVQAIMISTAAPNTLTAIGGTVAAGFFWWIGPLLFDDNDSRGITLGMIAALAPLAFLPMNRKPHWAAIPLAGAASFTLLIALGASRVSSSVLACFVCTCVALLSIGWLGSRFAIPRFIAACVCCAMVPLAVGMLACVIFGVDLRSVDHVLLYPRFIVEVDTTNLAGRDGFIMTSGATGWRNSRADWSATLFFGTTLISTLLLYRIALRAYPKLTTAT
jgi:ABC-type transport system involved in multi-copper enzyme maturation permease subunit